MWTEQFVVGWLLAQNNVAFLGMRSAEEMLFRCEGQAERRGYLAYLDDREGRRGPYTQYIYLIGLSDRK
jgi:hypothetical protein